MCSWASAYAFRALQANSKLLSILSVRAPITSLLLQVVAKYDPNQVLNEATANRLNQIFDKALKKANAKYSNQKGFVFGDIHTKPKGELGTGTGAEVEAQKKEDQKDEEFLGSLLLEFTKDKVVDAHQQALGVGDARARREMRDQHDAIIKALKGNSGISSTGSHTSSSSTQTTTSDSSSNQNPALIKSDKESDVDSGLGSLVGSGLLRAAAASARNALFRGASKAKSSTTKSTTSGSVDTTGIEAHSRNASELLASAVRREREEAERRAKQAGVTAGGAKARAGAGGASTTLPPQRPRNPLVEEMKEKLNKTSPEGGGGVPGRGTGDTTPAFSARTQRYFDQAAEEREAAADAAAKPRTPPPAPKRGGSGKTLGGG